MDTGNVNVVKGDLHPLCIQMVVENVMQYCKFQDLKNYRLVSKIWLDSSLKYFRSSARVKLVAQEDGGGNMPEFLKFVNKKSNKHSERPYAEYTVSGKIGLTVRFWNTYGPCITELTLESCFFSSVGQFRSVIYTACPNLKRLTLRNCEVKEKVNYWQRQYSQETIQEPTAWEEPRFGENSEVTCLKIQTQASRLRVSMMEILSHFPSLTTLDVEWAGLDDKERLFQAVERIRQHDPNKLKLTSINTYARFMISPAFNRVLCDPSIQLKELTMTVGMYADNFIDKVRQVIWKNAGSLKKLIFRPNRPLSGNDNRPPIFGGIFSPLLDGQQLENLEEYTFRCVFQTMAFLKVAPNLKKLKMEPCTYTCCMRANPFQRTRLEDMEGVVMINCTKLDVSDLYLDEEDVKKLVLWFPNLEELRIRLDNDTFWMISAGCLKLTKLEVTGNMFDDRGLTGLDLNDVMKVNKRRRKRSWRPTTVPRASISSLKNLRYLSLKEYWNVGYAGAMGILEAPQLISLTMGSEVRKDLKLVLMSKIANCNFN